MPEGILTFLFYLPFILLFTVIGVYGERKISAFIQSRYGPMEVGPYGLLQTIADLLKMLQKENIVPKAADRIPFQVAPILIFVFIFAGFSVIPLTVEVSGAGLHSGVFFLMAIVSMDVLGIWIAAWSSNSKYSLFGGMRTMAQIISYEVPLGLCILCVVMISQTLDLQQMVYQQGILSNQTTYLFGIKSLGIDVTTIGGFLSWNIIQAPFLMPVFVIFFIAGLAESNRAPFDLPESESELVGGFHTEYSGFRWGIIMLSEYGMMLIISLLCSILFFGGWNTVFPNIGALKLAEWTTGVFWGIFWLLSKSLFFVFVQMWVRWTYPRLRVDQLMSL